MRKLRLLVAVAVMAIGLVPVTTSSVGAHEVGNPSCPATYLCVWVDSHHLDRRAQFAGTNSTWHVNWPWIADDDSSSKNAGTSGLRAKIWRDTGLSGEVITCLSSGTRTAHHSPNDEGSSNSWPSSC